MIIFNFNDYQSNNNSSVKNALVIVRKWHTVMFGVDGSALKCSLD